eukprot:20623-Pelagococcus_subviridis.AAC.2
MNASSSSFAKVDASPRDALGDFVGSSAANAARASSNRVTRANASAATNLSRRSRRGIRGDGVEGSPDARTARIARNPRFAASSDASASPRIADASAAAPKPSASAARPSATRGASVAAAAASEDAVVIVVAAASAPSISASAATSASSSAAAAAPASVPAVVAHASTRRRRRRRRPRPRPRRAAASTATEPTRVRGIPARPPTPRPASSRPTAIPLERGGADRARDGAVAVAVAATTREDALALAEKLDRGVRGRRSVRRARRRAGQRRRRQRVELRRREQVARVDVARVDARVTQILERRVQRVVARRVVASLRGGTRAVPRPRRRRPFRRVARRRPRRRVQSRRARRATDEREPPELLRQSRLPRPTQELVPRVDRVRVSARSRRRARSSERPLEPSFVGYCALLVVRRHREQRRARLELEYRVAERARGLERSSPRRRVRRVERGRGAIRRERRRRVAGGESRFAVEGPRVVGVGVDVYRRGGRRGRRGVVAARERGLRGEEVRPHGFVCRRRHRDQSLDDDGRSIGRFSTPDDDERTGRTRRRDLLEISRVDRSPSLLRARRHLPIRYLSPQMSRSLPRVPERVERHEQAAERHVRGQPFADARGFPEDASHARAVRIHHRRRFHLDVRGRADEEEERDEERLEVEERGHRDRPRVRLDSFARRRPPSRASLYDRGAARAFLRSSETMRRS